jgi:hypothetical protein
MEPTPGDVRALLIAASSTTSPAFFTVTVPIAGFVLGIWWIALRDNADRVVNAVVPVGATLVLLDPVLPIPFTVTALVMTLVVAALVLRPPPPHSRAAADG